MAIPFLKPGMKCLEFMAMNFTNYFYSRKNSLGSQSSEEKYFLRFRATGSPFLFSWTQVHYFPVYSRKMNIFSHPVGESHEKILLHIRKIMDRGPWKWTNPPLVSMKFRRINCTRNLMDGHGRGVKHVLYFLRSAQWLVRHGNHDSEVPKRRIIWICCFTLENTLIICDSSSNENLKKINFKYKLLIAT